MSRAHEILRTIREVYGVENGAAVPLHAPVFAGNESAYVQSTIESTIVSYVGEYVDRFEAMLRDITGAQHVAATVNGTVALQMAVTLAGAQPGDLVVTQALSFAATANAIAHAGAVPAFVDVERETLGMSPDALRAFLETECERTGDGVRHRATERRVAACLPMHSFGLPCRINELLAICEEWGLPLIEDAAEALGSLYQDRHCGIFGLIGTLSFNGNKIVTTGGGGAILTNDAELGRRAKHLTTTAKVRHRWRFYHDEVGYNFRLPNLNAALGCAQLEQLPKFVEFKRDLAQRYQAGFAELQVPFVNEPPNTRSNFWLCAILVRDLAEREDVLTLTNDSGIMTRPIWEPLHTLPMYQSAPRGPLPVTAEMAERLVSIPSGYKNG